MRKSVARTVEVVVYFVTLFLIVGWLRSFNLHVLPTLLRP